MDFVVEEDLKAHLTCWYIQKYVKENPQPQYLEHISQWANMAHHRRRVRCSARWCRSATKRNFQGLLISTSSDSKDDSSHGRDLWKLSVGSNNSVTSRKTLKLWFIASPWDPRSTMRFNQSGSLLPPSKTSKMHPCHWLEVKAAKKADVSQVSCFSLDTAVAKQQ